MCKQCTLLVGCPIAKQRNFIRCDHFDPIRYDASKLFQVYLKVEDAKKRVQDAKDALSALESYATDMVFAIQDQPDGKEILEEVKRMKENRFND